MSIRLTRKQIDNVGELFFRCDACGDNGMVYRQGENAGQLFRVTLALHSTYLVHEVVLDLCREHLRFLRNYVVHGAVFCPCGGLVERTGNTKSIQNSDGVWEELQCEYYAKNSNSHYHDWEPVD